MINKNQRNKKFAAILTLMAHAREEDLLHEILLDIVDHLESNTSILSGHLDDNTVLGLMKEYHNRYNEEKVNS